MKETKWSAPLLGVVFAGFLMSGLVGPEGVQGMQIDVPQAWGKCKGVEILPSTVPKKYTYTVKFTTGDDETSHSIRVDQIFNADMTPNYLPIEQNIFPHPSGDAGEQKDYTPSPFPNWSIDGHWIMITSGFVMDTNSFIGPTVICQANEN